jgi:hypothetical protein
MAIFSGAHVECELVGMDTHGACVECELLGMDSCVSELSLNFSIIEAAVDWHTVTLRGKNRKLVE